MMRLAATLLLFLTATSAEAAAVRLGPGPRIASGVAAAPRILGGAPPAARTRINTALARADARGRKAAAACKADSGPRANWTRTVRTTFTGPAFLSVLIHDDYDCGGAHPDFGDTALVFGLADGRLVDWAGLVPASLEAKGAIDTAPDGARLGVLTSPGLKALYGPLQGECQDVGDLIAGFMIWPDREAGGLVMAPVGLPHAMAACGDATTLKPDRLTALGFAPSLVAALTAPTP